VYGAGALRFFAVPYTIAVYPLLYMIFRGWAVGMGVGTWVGSTTSFKGCGVHIVVYGRQLFWHIALWALAANIAVSVALSLMLEPYLEPPPLLAD
jgi:hypothetical protein